MPHLVAKKTYDIKTREILQIKKVTSCHFLFLQPLGNRRGPKYKTLHLKNVTKIKKLFVLTCLICAPIPVEISDLDLPKLLTWATSWRNYTISEPIKLVTEKQSRS